MLQTVRTKRSCLTKKQTTQMHMFDQTNRTNRSCLTRRWIQETRRKDPAQKPTPPRGSKDTTGEGCLRGLPCCHSFLLGPPQRCRPAPSGTRSEIKRNQMNYFNKKSRRKEGSKENQSYDLNQTSTPKYESKENNRQHLKQKSAPKRGPKKSEE